MPQLKTALEMNRKGDAISLRRHGDAEVTQVRVTEPGNKSAS